MPRHLLAGLAATAAAGAVLLPATAAHAYPMCPINYSCGYVWYSDAARTNPVGGRVIDCQRVSETWGTQTAILSYGFQPCPAVSAAGQAARILTK